MATKKIKIIRKAKARAAKKAEGGTVTEPIEEVVEEVEEVVEPPKEEGAAKTEEYEEVSTSAEPAPIQGANTEGQATTVATSEEKGFQFLLVKFY